MNNSCNPESSMLDKIIYSLSCNVEKFMSAPLYEGFIQY